MKNKSEVLRKNNVKHFGKGDKVLLFAHGFGCDQNMWRHIYPHFQEQYQIVLFDYVGFGKSDETFYNQEQYSSLEGYAQDIVDICEALELKNVYLIGHSVSAMIALLASKKLSDSVLGLVLVSPSARYINDGEYVGGFEKEHIEELIKTLNLNYMGWSSTMAPLIMGKDQPVELQEELTNSFCRSNPKIASDFAHVTFYSDNREDLNSVEIDTLILQCQNDVIAPVEVGEYIHKSISNSSFHLLDATGHCPNLSAPEEVTEVLQNFLQKKE